MSVLLFTIVYHFKVGKLKPVPRAWWIILAKSLTLLDQMDRWLSLCNSSKAMKHVFGDRNRSSATGYILGAVSISFGWHHLLTCQFTVSVKALERNIHNSQDIWFESHIDSVQHNLPHRAARCRPGRDCPYPWICKCPCDCYFFKDSTHNWV